ncbi:MAG: hypothetical protein JST31_14790 [Actinobacteria bacterium]|nr:hypothetical protein [Actinomycetota bacterium]
MKAALGKLTYANVVATIALFVALGGASYAATQLPKNSVGAKQLKTGAVTPPKLSKKAKAALAGARGAQGAPGAIGPQGPEGQRGPQGPGAVTVDQHVPTNFSRQLVLGGVEVMTICQSGLVPQITLRGPGGGEVEGFGTENSYFSGTGIFPVDFRSETTSFNGNGPGSTKTIDIDLVARNPAVSKAFTRFDLHLEYPTCQLVGTYTPSTLG